MRKIIVAVVVVIMCAFAALSVTSKSTVVKTAKNTIKIDKADFTVKERFGAPKNDLASID